MITLKQDTLGYFAGSMSNTKAAVNLSVLLSGGSLASATSFSGGTPVAGKIVSVSAWVKYMPGIDSLGNPGADTGYGIEKEKLPIIFTQFVTTKASSEGSGMGLYVVKSVVNRHKGKIWAESEGKDKGATLFLELPVLKDIKAAEVKKDIKSKWKF